MYVQDEIMVEKFPRWSWNKLITEKRTRQTDNSRENIEIIVDDNQKKKKKIELKIRYWNMHRNKKRR